MTSEMETQVTPEAKSNAVANGGARIIVDGDDEVLGYGGLTSGLLWCWHIAGMILNNGQQVFMSAPAFLSLFLSVPSSPTDLSEMLAEGTKESHDKAENCQGARQLFTLSTRPWKRRSRRTKTIFTSLQSRGLGRASSQLPSTGEGLNFYQFEGIHSHKGFKQLYRSRMNELELDTDTEERLVEESNRAFEFNMMSSKTLGKQSQKKSKMQFWDTVMQRSWREVISTSAPIMQQKWDIKVMEQVASGNPTYAGQLAMMLLKHPPRQVALWVALLAGFAAWYLL
ncbi:hypothetical protein L3Q82_019529 [Scortum barcoo]|uniref:Uncharacterized protein n=1 Tax=Scortum barcoo TaxID=214431 RepID=A0ACB8VDH5_9TELE|nr:hypothetical protein L3Q82_019529 [Scortum barcoo]